MKRGGHQDLFLPVEKSCVLFLWGGGLNVLSQSRSTYFTPFAVFRGSLVRCKALPRLRRPSQLGSFSRLNLLNQLFQAASLSPVISVYWAIKEMEPFNFT